MQCFVKSSRVKVKYMEPRRVKTLSINPATPPYPKEVSVVKDEQKECCFLFTPNPNGFFPSDSSQSMDINGQSLIPLNQEPPPVLKRKSPDSYRLVPQTPPPHAESKSIASWYRLMLTGWGWGMISLLAKIYKILIFSNNSIMLYIIRCVI